LVKERLNAIKSRSLISGFLLSRITLLIVANQGRFTNEKVAT